MIDSVRDFMKSCPLLSEIDVNINYLNESAVSGAVENVSAQPVIKMYTDGGTMRQMLFTVSLRQAFGQEDAANGAAVSKLEQVSDWIETQSNAGILPSLEGKRSPVSLEIEKSGWLEDKTTDTAKYQLQCRLVYYQEP